MVVSARTDVVGVPLSRGVVEGSWMVVDGPVGMIQWVGGPWWFVEPNWERGWGIQGWWRAGRTQEGGGGAGGPYVSKRTEKKGAAYPLSGWEVVAAAASSRARAAEVFL